MSTINDKATVTLTVNGSQAKQMMADLEAKIKQTEAAITTMKANMANPKDIEKAKKQLANYKKQLEEMRSATEGVNKTLENLNLATPRQLEKALKTLNRQLKDMVPGSEVWEEHVEKIRQIKERLSELKDELGEQQSLWDKFNEWATNVWPSIDLLSSGYDSLVGGMREYVNAFADMDQEMANVSKYTGMTAEEVNSLNERLKEIDTRTSREELNKLAQEAGRLGKTSEEDVLGFVRAADKINVALDDLGAGATLTLSKLTGIFGDEAKYGTEQSLLKVGSVINELSQNCSASAPYIANFAERLGGVGAQAKMTIPQIMGMAAVLDSNSQKVEASATAISQVIVRLYQDPAKYARVAGLDVEKFANLMREDANSALILFLETLQKAGGMDVLSPMFKDMGENGSRAISALSTLATNIDAVKAQQEAANAAFEEGTSINNEFAVQNGTVQASLEKCANRANELRVELGGHLQPLMSHFLTTGAAIMRLLLTTIRFLIEHKTAVLVLAAAWGAYTLSLYKAAITSKIMHGWSVMLTAAHTAGRAAVLLVSAAYSLATGNITRATAAMKLFNATVKMNPIGLLLSVITAVTAAFLIFKERAEDAAKAQRQVSDAVNKTSSELRTEQTEIDNAFAALKRAKKGTKEYETAKKNIIDQYGQYLTGLINERNELYDVEAAYYRVSAAARDAALARGMAEAKNAVGEKFKETDADLMGQVEEKLQKYLKDKDDLAAIMQLVRADLPKYHDISVATGNIIRESINKGRKENSWDEVYGAIRAVGKNYVKYESDIKEVETRFGYSLNEFEQYTKEQLDIMYDDLANQLADKKTKSYDVIAGGSIVGQYDTKAKAAAALTKIDNARTAKAATDKVEEQKPEETTPIAPKADTKVKDRFAAEKAARDRAEAEAKISYYKGESDYEQYTKRMGEIALDYYQSLINRTDLAADERLSIEAQYWEEKNKQTISGNKALIDEENSAYERTIFNLKEAYRQRLEAGNMSAQERAAAEKTHREETELAELEHLKKLVALYKEGSAERLNAEKAYQDARLNAQKRHQQEAEAQEAELAKYKDKYFGDSPEEKQQKYDVAYAALKEVYDRELAAAEGNAAEKLRIEEDFQKAQKALRQQYELEAEEDVRSSYQKAIEDSVAWLKGPQGQALTGTMSTLVSGMSNIFSGLSTMMQAELEIQTSKIEAKYDKEIELAQGNSYKVAKLEKQKEKAIAKAKNEANRKMFAMQVIQAVAQTAQNAISAYGSAAAIPLVGYILAPVAAAMAIAAGAVQIAAIKKQQQASEAKGYSSGGYTGDGGIDEPAGVVHRGEWVASQKLLKNPVSRAMIEQLDYVQRTNTIGRLNADDVSRSITAPQTMSRVMGDDGTAVMVAAALSASAQSVKRLNERLNEPIVAHTTVAGDHGINQAQQEYENLLRNVTPRSKRK